MIPKEVLTEELLQHAATEFVTVLNNNLHSPNECQRKFSNAFEEEMQLLIRGISITCYIVTI